MLRLKSCSFGMHNVWNMSMVSTFHDRLKAALNYSSLYDDRRTRPPHDKWKRKQHRHTGTAARFAKRFAWCRTIAVIYCWCYHRSDRDRSQTTDATLFHASASNACDLSNMFHGRLNTARQVDRQSKVGTLTAVSVIRYHAKHALIMLSLQNVANW